MSGDFGHLRRRDNLPADVSSFVGRRRQLAGIRRLLSTARLVTLTGTGGVGKTRIALRAAAESRRAFVDGVCQVDLAPVQDPSIVEYRVAEALGLHDQTDRPPTQVIVDFLHRRQVLLVLDNCEHLLPDCARLVGAILAAAPAVRVMCTSREPLGSPGEHVWPVPPMTVPDLGQPWRPGSGSTYSSLVLFAERASAVVAGFALTARNETAVAWICRRLDGLPLAIELAAVQLRTLSLDQLSSMLDDRLIALSTRHAIPAYHRTLQATFDWSFDLCTPQQRAFWCRTAVFTGSFDLAAAEYVCGGDHLAGVDVSEVITGLVDKSVLIAEDHAGQSRYRLLEPVRRYSLERLRGLPDGAERALRRRHRDWYVLLAERFDAEWFGPHQVTWANRMRQEFTNVQAALSFCLDTPGEAPTGLHLACCLRYYGAIGPLREILYWLERALAADPEPTRTRALALQAYGRLIMVQGDHSMRVLKEGLDLTRRLGRPAQVAGTTTLLARSLMLRDDVTCACVLAEEAVALFHDLGERSAGTAEAYINLAMLLLIQGDPVSSAQISAECRDLCRTAGDQWLQGYALVTAAYAALAMGNSAEASGYLQESLRLRHPLGDVLGMAGSFERLAWVAADHREYERGALLLGMAHDLWQAVGQMLYGAKRWIAGHDECETTIRREIGDDAFEDLFQRGAALDLDRAVAYALGGAGVRIPAPVDGGDADVANTLTPREQQVADLICQGLSNKQIAHRLAIGQRTAESHVGSILRKLGLTSRAQVAAALTPRQGQASG